MGKHLHRLSEVDPIKRTASCAHCGQVKVYKHVDRFRCANALLSTQARLRREAGIEARQFDEHVVTQVDGKYTCSQCGLVTRRMRLGRLICPHGTVALTRAVQSTSRHHGLPWHQANDLRVWAGSCMACGESTMERTLHIDHCHSTGRVRGVLCGACNATLGQARDDIDRLKSLITYLEEPPLYNP